MSAEDGLPLRSVVGAFSTPAAATAYSPKRGATSTTAAASKATLKARTPASGMPSPSTARAGHQMTLPMPGACASRVSDCKTLACDSVPSDRIAAICNPMTKAAPITAASICATSRVRFGPMARNKATVIATASAAAAVPMAMITP